VNQPIDESEKQRLWQSLVEAGLLDIAPNQFAERIKDAKHVVMGRLGELLERRNNVQERESAAYSLATLRKLETTLSEGAKRHSSE
jgi:hypothetical protein